MINAGDIGVANQITSVQLKVKLLYCAFHLIEHTEWMLTVTLSGGI